MYCKFDKNASTKGEREYFSMPKEKQEAMLKLTAPLKEFKVKSNLVSVYWLKHLFEDVNLNGLKGSYTSEACFAYILNKNGMVIWSDSERMNYDGHSPLYVKLSRTKILLFKSILDAYKNVFKND